MGANATNISRIQIRKRINFTETIDVYCKNFVVEHDRKDLIQALQRDNLVKELAEQERFVYRYESIPNKEGHHFFEVQVIRLNADYFDGNVLVAFRHIDDVLKRQPMRMP